MAGTWRMTTSEKNCKTKAETKTQRIDWEGENSLSPLDALWSRKLFPRRRNLLNSLTEFSQFCGISAVWRLIPVGHSGVIGPDEGRGRSALKCESASDLYTHFKPRRRARSMQNVIFWRLLSL
jgi:hypothetical protein